MRLAGDGDLHPPSALRELRRVLEEVPDRLRDARRVGVQPERQAPEVLDELDATGGEERLVVLDGAVHELGEIDAPLLQVDLAARDAGHVQQVVHDPAEVVDLALDDLLRSARLLAAGLGAVQQPHRVPDRRERVPELVREDAEELGLAAIGLAERLLRSLPLRRQLLHRLSRGHLARDVEQRQEHALHLTGVVLHGDQGPVPVGDAALGLVGELERLLLDVEGLARRGDAPEDALVLLVREELEVPAADQLLPAVPAGALVRVVHHQEAHLACRAARAARASRSGPRSARSTDPDTAARSRAGRPRAACAP